MLTGAKNMMQSKRRTVPTRDLSSSEAADILRLSKHTVIRLYRAGKIQAWRTPGGHLRFRLGDVDTYAKQLHGELGSQD
jgi:excisionase family DNA binding protein